MATSGTVGATTTDVTKILEHAFRRASVPASKITGEQQLAAQDNLFFILTDLANGGINLWCIVKMLVAYTVGQATYPLTNAVVDLLRAYNRTMFFPTGLPISTATTLGLTPTSPVSTSCVGVTVSSSSQAQNLAVQYNNGSGWVTVLTIPTFTGVAGQLYWFDLPVIVSGAAWQVLETVAVSIAVSNVQFGNTPSDIQMGRLTRDDYWGMPNKAVPGKALQYWYDKQVVPQVWVWQVPNDATQLMVCEVHQHIQDVGALTNALSIPNRWLNWAIWELAFYCANERPPEERDDKVIAVCERRAEKSRVAAEMGETDGAPLRIMPNLRAYTR